MKKSVWVRCLQVRGVDGEELEGNVLQFMYGAHTSDVEAVADPQRV